MTLTQLEAFVLVARLGSVTAAARTLGVSEPAVSGALAALRRHFGDELLQRSPQGMDLTAGGRGLLPIASRMVALASEADDAIRRAHGAPDRLRVVATSAVAELVAPALLEAFRPRGGHVEVSLGVVTAAEVPALLHERLADVALGPAVAGEAASGLECVPLFRYRLVLVASPRHPLALGGPLPLRSLAGQTWLVDPEATDPASPVQRLLRHVGVPDDHTRVFPSQSAAWAAAEQGLGVAPAMAHLVAGELRRRTLARLEVERTPIELMWHATVLPPGRRSPAASALCRFMVTPDATHAMHSRLAGVPPSRFRPPVYVTIWS